MTSVFPKLTGKFAFDSVPLCALGGGAGGCFFSSILKTDTNKYRAIASSNRKLNQRKSEQKKNLIVCINKIDLSIVLYFILFTLVSKYLHWLFFFSAVES